jgi:hypothetical protein
MKKLLLVALSGLMFGCAADGGMGVEGSPIWFMRTTPAQQAAYFGQVCAGYGYAANTPEMSQCIAMESREARAQGAANMRAANANMQLNRPRSTTCNRTIGGNYNCTTW